jgi:hypothetical protein
VASGWRVITQVYSVAAVAKFAVMHNRRHPPM